MRGESLARRLDYLLRSRLWAQTLVAMIAGIALGLGLSPSGGAWVSAAPADTIAGWLALPGQVFLALIQMIVILLVLSSIILGLASLVVFYLLIVVLLARRNPWQFLTAVREVQSLAFSTSSSAAVMPLSMQTAQTSLGVRSSVAQFIVPLGATVNMVRTALYQVVAALFLTQVYGIDLSAGQLLLLAVTTVGASIGSPSTPGVGIVILATIVAGIGVPPAGIALIIGVDRILDMLRTAINVAGDLAACVVMDRWLPADAMTSSQ